MDKDDVLEVFDQDEVFLVEELLEGEPPWLSPIKRALNAQTRRLNKIMADLSALEAAVAVLVTDETAAAAELQSLVNEVATLTAGEISQERVDAITQSVSNVATALGAATADAQAPPAGTAPAGTEPDQSAAAGTSAAGSPADGSAAAAPLGDPSGAGGASGEGSPPAADPAAGGDFGSSAPAAS